MKIRSTDRSHLEKIAEEKEKEKARLEAALKQQELEELDTFDNEIREGLRTAYIAYSDKQIAKAYLKNHAYQEDSFLALDSLVGTQGFCCIRKRRAYIAFRGTTFAITDLLIDLAMLPWYKPCVHFGFGHSWNSVSTQVNTWLDKHATEFDSLSLSGHSLGGAIAHVAAVHLATDWPISNVVTMGSPRSSFWSTHKQYKDTPLKDSDKTLGQVTYRLVNGLDVVAKVPPSFVGYRHVGEMFYLSISGELTRGEAAIKEKRDDKLYKKIWTAVGNYFSPYDYSSSYSSNMLILPGQEKKSMATLVDGLKKYREVFPLNLIEGIFIGIFFCILPIIAFLMYSLYFLQSGLSHFKTNYIPYYFNNANTIDYELVGVRKKLGIKESSEFVKSIKRIISKTVEYVFIAAYTFAIYKITSVWVIPMLKSFIGGIKFF
jgi:hypothetical protein